MRGWHDVQRAERAKKGVHAAIWARPLSNQKTRGHIPFSLLFEKDDEETQKRRPRVHNLSERLF
jgi:hypothetical protein